MALARRLLAEGTPSEEIEKLSDQEDVRFLFLDKRVVQQSLDNLAEAGFEKQFENGLIIIMEREATSPW